MEKKIPCSEVKCKFNVNGFCSNETFYNEQPIPCFGDTN